MPQRALAQWFFGALASSLVVGAGAAAQPEQREEPEALVEAIRKSQEIAFHFHSFTTFYSCASLEDKVERIMRALAVDARVSVRSPDCPGSIARMPRILIEATSLVEATPEAIAEREKGRSQRELVARVRGERGEDIEGVERFPARWQRVRLSRGELDLGPGDCELIEQMKRHVLSKLGARIVRDELHCSPNLSSLNQPRLEVEVLVGVPEPDRSPAKEPDGAHE
ncbi:MAG TPA: hypothetical protein VF161_03075 [Steroidobacteraceae bacterium]